MVVLQVLPSLVAGGVERGTVEMARAVTEAGGRALVASAGGKLVSAVQYAGGRHFTMPLATKDPLNIWWNAGRLAELIREERVEIVHARSRAPAWSALLAARRAGVRFVTTYHGTYGEGVPFKRRYNAVMAKGDRVIAISRHIAALVAARHGVGPDRLRVIPRGVDPAMFDPDAVSGDRIARLATEWRLPERVRVVLLPGRLTRWKGHGVLIEAIGRLADPGLCCVLMGDGRGGYAAELARQAERLGVTLRMPGPCDDVPAAMMLADAVVHAATEPEAFGRVVIEAQAMGRPVIASDLGGPVETVEPGVTGWLIPPGDVRALADTLRYVLALSNADRATLGRQTREAVLARYTTRAMQDATLAVYRELVS